VSSLLIRADLGPYREQWDRLVASAPVPSVHLRSWWIEGLAGPHTRFVLVVDGERLLGGVGLEQARRWGITTLRSIGGDLGPVHVDVLAACGEEQVVREHVRRWFSSQRDCVVDLDGVPAGSHLCAALPPAVEQSPRPGVPVCEVPERFDRYLASRSSQLRRRLQEAEERLEQQGGVYRRLEPHQVRSGIAALLGLQAGPSVDARTGDRHEKLREVWQAGAERGEVVVHAIEREGELVAGYLVAVFADTVFGVISGHDGSDGHVRGAEQVLVARTVEDACERRLRRIVLHRCPDPAALEWADELPPLRHLHGAWGERPRRLDRARSVRALAVRKLRGARHRLRLLRRRLRRGR
jgi:hypothetical protein